MKKLMSLMLAAVLALTLTACGGDTSTDTDSSSADSEGVYTITIGNTGSEQCSDYAGATAFKEYVEADVQRRAGLGPGAPGVRADGLLHNALHWPDAVYKLHHGSDCSGQPIHV